MGAVALTAVLLASGSAAAFDSEREQNNYRKLGERSQEEQANPDYQAGQAVTGAENVASLVARDATEGDRLSVTMCAAGASMCNRDHRLDDWGSYGVRHQVVFVNRNGAQIEGSVWASNEVVRAGVPVPAVVIETGSVQAPENWYRWAAQVLAARGYVVLTFDVQGQGRSDTFGSGAQIFRGVPAQSAEHFVESAQDALDFLLSSTAAPYVPRDADAAALQAAEATAGDAAAHNPLASLVDATRVGAAGHSLGAYGVSALQDRDTRVDAIVAWDNLRTGRQGETAQPVPDEEFVPRVPALGMSADYGLVPSPKRSDPDPDEKNAAFEHWAEHGMDVMQVNVRGAHYEWSYSPGIAFIPPATLRGIDAAAWYTTAWFDRYLKGDATADRRLLTDRWLADPIDAAVDPPEGGNLLSFYYRSRAAFELSDGTPVACDDMRAGCGGLLVADDGEPRDPAYSYLEDRKRGR